MPHRNQAASASKEGSTEAKVAGGIREHTLALWQKGEIKLSSDQLQMMGFEVSPINKMADVVQLKRD